MYYAMNLTENVATRVGRMTPNIATAIAAAQRAGRRAYVEQYGVGVVWTPKVASIAILPPRD